MDPKLVASLSNFSIRFLSEQIKKKEDLRKPLICSPLSAEVVLALTALGSAGDTHAELLQTMDLPDDEALRSLFSYLTSTLKAVEGVTLNIANRLYLTKTGTLKPGVKKDAKKVFESGLKQLDFEQSVAAANIMNAWVAKQTNNMIPSIVSPDWLDKDTSMVLINAIYFQGLWTSPFPKSFTIDRPFHVDNKTQIQVPMMSKPCAQFRYKHSPELKAKILQMFYQGQQASMVIVLPDEVEGLSDLLEQLAGGHDLTAEIEDLRTTSVDVVMPKFKVETVIDLKSLLPKMGIKKIFDPRESEIQMLESGERCFVSQAVQKAVIEVDEAGTKAAAVTAHVYHYLCADYSPPKPQKFIADRPFFFLLKSREIQLFVGIYQGDRSTEPGNSMSLKRTGGFYLCCAMPPPPKAQKFVADRPFFFLLRSREIPLFSGIYQAADMVERTL